jgi:hypothetical protein
MCMGGNNATQQAEQQQQQQQEAVTGNVNAINSAFANRSSQYSSYLSALNSSYQQQLNLQQAQAARGLKFSLADSGLTGSSVAADQGAELQREMGQATVGAEQQAQAKEAGLQSSDQATRLQMIQLAQSGANIGNAAEQTATALSSNLQNAQANLAPNSLGNAFGGIAQDVSTANTAYMQRQGLRAAGAYTGAFSNTPTSNAGFTGA